MPVINWSERYVTGIPDVDNDHQKIFALINNLHDKHEAGQSNIDLDIAIAELNDYVRYHFEREEGLLFSIGYKALDNHIALHRDIAGQLQDYASQYEADQKAFDMAGFIAFLARWLDNHIFVEDMAYVSSVKKLIVRI